MKYSKGGKQAKRGGTRSPGKGASPGQGENRQPVKSGTGNFTASAKKVHAANRRVPMRGGIRL